MKKLTRKLGDTIMHKVEENCNIGNYKYNISIRELYLPCDWKEEMNKFNYDKNYFENKQRELIELFYDDFKDKMKKDMLEKNKTTWADDYRSNYFDLWRISLPQVKNTLKINLK